jgi:hypothetical protein
MRQTIANAVRFSLRSRSRTDGQTQELCRIHEHERAHSRISVTTNSTVRQKSKFTRGRGSNALFCYCYRIPCIIAIPSLYYYSVCADT